MVLVGLFGRSGEELLFSLNNKISICIKKCTQGVGELYPKYLESFPHSI